MIEDTPAVPSLVRSLEEIETKLECALCPGVPQEKPVEQLSLQDLSALKAVVDRLRPLLWMYVTRASESQSASRTTGPVSTVTSLIDDAFQISDRYMSSTQLRQQLQLHISHNGK